MTRPTGGGGASVHVGKAAALILVALLIGIVVLKDDSSGGGTSLSAAERAALSGVTTTTAASSDSSDEGDSTDTTQPLREPPLVKVQAINATKSANGVAGTATTKLQTEGYNAVAGGTAVASLRATAPASAVYVVTKGFEREAAAVAALFGLPASAVRELPATQISADLKAVDVVLLIGTGITL